MSNRKIADILINAIKTKHRIYICGNGGSASMANHFAAEFVNRFLQNRTALPMISLASDIAVITSIANDHGYEFVFVRQLQALAKKNDVLITLSTSGISKNIIYAERFATDRGMIIIPFPHNNDLDLDTPHTQEAHLRMLHDISEKVEIAFL